MSKKKAPKKTANTAQERRSVAVTLKGSEEWKEWLEGAAEHCRTTVSAFIDLATAEYAKVRGYPKESPKR